MAPKAKSKPTRFIFTIGTVLAMLTTLALTAWAAASSASLIYRPELPLLY
jgi:uncharacterized BrkB/YihY/UPF0761 family membrane protein